MDAQVDVRYERKKKRVEAEISRFLADLNDIENHKFKDILRSKSELAVDVQEYLEDKDRTEKVNESFMTLIPIACGLTKVQLAALDKGFRVILEHKEKIRIMKKLLNVCMTCTNETQLSKISETYKQSMAEEVAKLQFSEAFFASNPSYQSYRKAIWVTILSVLLGFFN